MPHNRGMLTDRRALLVRAVGAAAGMTVVMLLVAALGRWVLIPAGWARRLDEGGTAAGFDLGQTAPWLVDGAQVWSVLSGPWVVHPLVIALTLALLARRRVDRAALAVPAVGLLGWWLGATCKEIVQRARPEEAVVTYGSWSYPSGHATNAALGAVLLIALLGAVRTTWVQRTGIALVVLAAALTAADRIVLGVHYVTDVSAGLLLGVAMALVGLRAVGPIRSAGDAPARRGRARRRGSPAPRP